MSRILRIGTRPSRLAIKQVEEISALLPGLLFKVITIKTKGDKDKATPLAALEGTDFFTHEIEEALLAGWIDLGIHSAKDLEEAPPGGLMIAATTTSISPHDCLVSGPGRGKTLKTLIQGSTVGTSSIKRREAIQKFRKDLIIKDIRGDIDERLEQLDRGDFDAIIVAHAALIRLGYEARISEIISEYIIEPHPLQGKLAIQIRRDRTDLADIFRRINAN
jgi:hydroxymethylbilane synthase